ncbi:ROK family transcriptional regulator [Mucilaginibacter sp. SP1R1]|uniref:ROK family transcriptional regulator n=1 Tax=Mucilaginibacter sp. SP1R1 TaxID=2723091 RepID=UPI00161FA5AB|nr:ROK family transcriptional regulator [Mucilaginibacter sp. SP1R1]MBB6147673.1 putative NBD/HSP70 family sugar kinase [Mucilaginibacter sp. SP1R1]
MLLENINHLPVIKALYFNGTVSCAEISKITGSSIPNVSKNLTELIEAGIVAENGFASSKGGRKPLLYALIPDRFYIVSVAIDQFYTKIGIVNLDNEFITEIEGFEFNLYAPSTTSDGLVNKINGFINNSNIDKNRICAIGISLPGFVDVEKGINKTFFKDAGEGLRDYIAENTGFSTFIDNDSSAIALAELKFGIGREKKEMMVLNISWGIGLGMIVNGEIFRGFSGFAGEFSHIPLFKNEKICSCGKRGCLETEASLILIQQQAKEAIEEKQPTRISLDKNGNVAIKSIMTEAKNGDALAIKLISNAGYQIGRALAVLVHIMNPQTIVLSGKGGEAGKLWLAPIQQALNELCIPVLLDDIEVVVSTLGNNAQLIGGAALVIENIDQISSLNAIQVHN